MTAADPAAAYDRLRAETAAMFEYDIASASLTQGLQIDLVSLLRMEIDNMQGKVLAGETVDLSRLVAAHGLLRQMLPEKALVAPAPEPEARFGPDHRAKLKALIERTLFPPEEAAALADAQAREERVMVAEAFRAPPEAVPAPVAASPARLNDEAAKVVAPDFAAPPPTPPPQSKTAEANQRRPPDHYLRGRERWRDHIGADGNVIAPWFRPHG